MLSSQEEQAERRRVLAQDASLRQQSGTFMSHAQASANDLAGGRFAATGNPHVVGSESIPQYPQASTPFQFDPVPNEEPLSAYDNPEFEPSTTPACPVEASGPASAPSYPVDVERAGPSSSGDPAGVHFPSPPGTSSDVNAGSLPYRRVRR
jgi:hypothetical protein